MISTALSLDKISVAIGQTITGNVTFRNCNTSSTTLQRIVIAGRPPGGTHLGGPWLDFSPQKGSTTLASGETVSWTASRTMASTDPTGAWYSFATYQDTGGTWHDGPDANFTVTAGMPAGWLYTNGNKIYVSDGAGGGTQWMARGVNVDDVFFCGYNHTLWMSDPQTTLETVFSGLMSGWRPTFVRMSLGMSSYVNKDWTTGDATYTTPTTNAINFLGSYPDMHVRPARRSTWSAAQHRSRGRMNHRGILCCIEVSHP